VGTYWPKDRRGKIRWHVVDAGGRTLGRLVARAALVLMGKNCPDYSPHLDHREGLIVLNADKVNLTGRKLDQKFYRHYSGYPGGLTETSARDTLARQPEKIIREAIKGMLPKTRMGARLAARVRVYAGDAHPHAAQMPETLSLDR
jgi:large subunit ribosomal protein L13